MISCLNLKSEHGALEAINRLEAAILVWKERVAEHGNGKSPIHTSWSFAKVELDKMESLTNRAELLLLQLKCKYPNLPQTFLDVTKIQYGKVCNTIHSSAINRPNFPFSSVRENCLIPLTLSHSYFISIKAPSTTVFYLLSITFLKIPSQVKVSLLLMLIVMCRMWGTRFLKLTPELYLT